MSTFLLLMPDQSLIPQTMHQQISRLPAQLNINHFVVRGMGEENRYLGAWNKGIS